MSESNETPFFTAFNNHVESCGKPPVVTTKGDIGYSGYYENNYGEQWVVRFDRATKVVTLRGGDIGWDEPKTAVLKKKPDTCVDTELLAYAESDLLPQFGTGMNLGERYWLLGCLVAILSSDY